MEYINDVALNPDAVEEYCDRVGATEWERHHLLLKVYASYEWSHFIKDVWDFMPTRKFVRPGTFFA